MHGIGNDDDVEAGDSDDEGEFTDDEDGFVMMTPTVTLSQKIAVESAASKISFTRSTYPKIAIFVPHLTVKAGCATHEGTHAYEKGQERLVVAQILIYNGYTSVCCNTL
jgi:hypothetical protein